MRGLSRSSASGQRGEVSRREWSATPHPSPLDQVEGRHLLPQGEKGSQAGVNTGAGGPPSVGWNFTFTRMPMLSPSGATSTKLVNTAGPSSSVT